VSTTPPEIPGLVSVQPLGSGGYADVYLYEQQMPRMPVAVKVLKADGMTPAIRRQFIDEADTMAQLADHPYIVQVFRADTSADGRPYLVMKYYPPPNLAQRARSQRFTVEEVLRTGIQLASAVETAHRAGVIHRDIKPANVLVSQYGSPGLTDFGIAGRGRALEEDNEDEVGVSVPWAPPEVLFGHSNGGPRSDVYSLAATLWQLLVGRSPFEVPGGDNSAYALMPRIRTAPVPGTGRADVPVSLERLLAQAMAKNEHSRPESALSFARALQEIEQEQRFPRTAIVVLDESGHTTVADSSRTTDDIDATRVRAPQTVAAPQRPAVPTLTHGSAPRMSGGSVIPGVARAPETTTPTVRAASPSTLESEAEEGTVRVQRDRPATPAAEPDRSGSLTISPVVLLGIIAALVVGLVFVSVQMFGAGDPATTPTGNPRTLSVSATDDPVFDVPQTPQLAAAALAGKVVFSWTASNMQDGDQFIIRVAPKREDVPKAVPQRVGKGQQTSVAAKKGETRCAAVFLVRSGNSSAMSDIKCERAK
jgi:serine/threonine protein kinase